jgi:hypothetical protein
VTAAAEAFACYERARDAVCRMNGGVLPPARSGLEALREATPDVIANLREYSKAITGVRRSQYKGTRADLLRVKLEKDLERLLAKGDRSLFVDEPRALGGYGFESFGVRYNEDTLRFFRVLSLLHDAALIPDLRNTVARPTVWEIGGGWGGLAFQLKTVCPGITYLITGDLDLYLVSAVYLQNMFPGAHARFYDPADPAAFWRDWHDVDFAFAPERAVTGLTPPRLLLTVDMTALERMDPMRIERHVGQAYMLGSRYFLTVCPSTNVEDATHVEPIVDRWYWRHPVSTPAGLTKRLALGASKRGETVHTYRLGWRRLHS